MKDNLTPFAHQRKSNQTPKAFSFNLQTLLYKKYSCSEYTYPYISTLNLIFNEKCSIVSRFKDYLIYDDSTDFLRRAYTLTETSPRLNRILTFYDTYSKIFPNYMILPESEHLYKNIRKKQKMIDAMNAIKQEEEENRKKIARTYKSSIEAYQSNCNTVFTPKIQKSIIKYKPSRINDQTITESSISISLMFKKYVPNFDNSFAIDDFGGEGDRSYDANSIAEIVGVLNGKEINYCAINVQQKRLSDHMTTQQTPSKPKKTINYFQSEAINNRNMMTMFYGNKTSTKNVNGKVLRKMPMSPCIKKNNNNALEHNTITNYPQAKPVNNLKIITNNYQNIIIPPVNNLGGNTVININNNYYTCTDARNDTKKEMKRIQSLSPKQMKPNANTATSGQNSKHLVGHNLFSPKATNQTGSRSIKREVTSPLKSLQEPGRRDIKIQSDRIRTISNTNKFKTHTNNNNKSNNTNNTRVNTNNNSTNLQKSRGKSSRQNSKSSRRIKEKSINNNLNKYNKINSNYYLNQMCSPLREKERERELSKERDLTNEIKHKFKMFIAKRQLNSLSNGGLCDSFSPKKSHTTNRLSSNITTNNNSMQRTQVNNHSQKNLNIDPNSKIKVLNTITHRLLSPVANSLDEKEGIVPKIKVNTKPFMERNLSNGFMIMSNMQRNLNAEAN